VHQRRTLRATAQRPPLLFWRPGSLKEEAKPKKNSTRRRRRRRRRR
jgi:hypothetical protein